MREARFRQLEDSFWAGQGVEKREETVIELPHVGTRVRVQMAGRGEPVLFVHGGPAVGSVFASLVPLLQDFRCIVIDRPGSGLSTPVDHRRWRLDDLAVNVLGGVLDGLGLSQVDVVASSLGGAWAQWFTHRQPQRVKRLVQLGAPALLPEMQKDAIFFHRLLSLPVVGALVASAPQNPKSVAGAFRSMGHGHSLDTGRWSEDFFTLSASIANDTDTWKHERTLIRRIISFGGVKAEAPRVLDEHLRVPHPTLWYWGAEEPFAPRSALERVASLNPNATVDLAPSAGHLPWLDDPQRAAAAIRRHLRPVTA